MLYIFLTVIYIFTRYKRRIILLLVRLRYSCSGTRSLLSVVYLFLSLTGGTPRRLVRHHRSGIQKKQDDTRQSSNGPRTRTPPTHVITAWKTNCDLKGINFYQTAVFLNPYLRDKFSNRYFIGIIWSGNPGIRTVVRVVYPFIQWNFPSSPCSADGRCKVLCRKTIGAGTRVRLGFPNARPVVSDELARSSAGQWRKALADRSRRTGLTA